MIRYWVIAPYNSTRKELFDIAWNYDLSNSTIAIGWSELGDVSKCSKEEIAVRVREVYQDKGDRWLKYTTTKTINALWNFYHEISIGDLIIARKGLKKLIGIGEVIDKAYYNEKEGALRTPNTNHKYSNFIKVKWTPKEIDYEEYVFSQFTILQIDKVMYNFLINYNIEVLSGDESKISHSIQEFALEKYLEEFIINNFDSIFQGSLNLVKDENGKPNQQEFYDDELKSLGKIDILAQDSKDNAYVVIELKKGKSSDKVVGQLSRYIAMVQENLCENGESVRGLIICKEKDKKLEYALKPQPLMSMKFYDIDFKLRE